MRTAQINQHGIPAGLLEELPDSQWRVSYFHDYSGPPLSLTLPVEIQHKIYASFPPVFEGLLPEGIQLEAVLKQHKIDRHDFFSLLMVVGGDLVGSLTFQPFHNESNEADGPTHDHEGGESR